MSDQTNETKKENERMNQERTNEMNNTIDIDIKNKERTKSITTYTPHKERTNERNKTNKEIAK